MVAERIITADASKLGMIPAFADTTLADDPGAAGAGEDELCEAMDWLLVRQSRIEQKLAKRQRPMPARKRPK